MEYGQKHLFEAVATIPTEKKGEINTVENEKNELPFSTAQSEPRCGVCNRTPSEDDELNFLTDGMCICKRCAFAVWED
jgi:hypothetical protein